MTWAEFKADLAGLLPTDAEREGTIEYVDRLTRACMISLQGNIKRLEAKTTTTLVSTSLQAVGNSSLGTVPSSGSIKILEAWWVRTATGGIFKVGHTYRITAIGTTDFTLIGATANTVGLFFVATGVGAGTGTGEECRSELHQWPWSARFRLINGIEQNSAIVLDPFGVQFYVAPMLEVGDAVEITWVGIKMTFAGADVLPDNWDQEVVKAVSNYVMSHVAHKIDNDMASSEKFMKQFNIDRRGIYAREQARKLLTGT